MSTTKVLTGVAAIVVLLGLSYFLGTRNAVPPAVNDQALRRQLASLRTENQRLSQELARATAAMAPVAPVPNTTMAPITLAPPASSAANGIMADLNYNSVLNNLRQLRAAASQFRLEKGYSPTSVGELVGPDKYIKALRIIDGEDYEALSFSSDTAPLSVSTLAGQSITLGGDGVLTSSSPYVGGLNRAMTAFQAANGGRVPSGLELGDYFDDSAARAEFMRRAKGEAFQKEMQEILTTMGSAVNKASNAYTATTGQKLSSWQSQRALIPYLEDAADQERLNELWRKLDAQFGP